ncbi:MAG: maleylpyruvate isomerase family mycothiol-dependent enzyme [Acidimicrobiia bacterium]|nr:maleylpyruvate isomerase family mycothiol-dependent enzyme [Acidimicrobiia bacterium]
MTDLIPLFEEVWGGIEVLCSDLTDTEWSEPTDLPGWSVKDCVAHIVGTESFLAGKDLPSPLDVYPPYVKNPIGQANENFVATTRHLSGPEVLAAFRTITAERLDQLRALSPDDWAAESWSPRGQGTYRDFMEVRVFDCWSHEQDMRRALGKPGDTPDAVLDQVMSEMTRALPYVVGKKAGAAQGATVVFDISGPGGKTLALGVDGRAHFLDSVPDDPAVRISMDLETFRIVTGGRVGEDVARESVGIEGDTDLGTRIVKNLAFVI